MALKRGGSLGVAAAAGRYVESDNPQVKPAHESQADTQAEGMQAKQAECSMSWMLSPAFTPACTPGLD
jgi:hypothetical protein